MWTKTIGTAVLSLALVSCGAGPAVIAQDYKAGTLTVCGGTQVSNEDLQKKAVQACTTGAPKLLRCVSNVSYTAVGIQGQGTVTGNCCDYECPVAATPPPAQQ